MDPTPPPTVEQGGRGALSHPCCLSPHSNLNAASGIPSFKMRLPPNLSSQLGWLAAPSSQQRQLGAVATARITRRHQGGQLSLGLGGLGKRWGFKRPGERLKVELGLDGEGVPPMVPGGRTKGTPSLLPDNSGLLPWHGSPPHYPATGKILLAAVYTIIPHTPPCKFQRVRRGAIRQ